MDRPITPEAVAITPETSAFAVECVLLVMRSKIRAAIVGKLIDLGYEPQGPDIRAVEEAIRCDVGGHFDYGGREPRLRLTHASGLSIGDVISTRVQLLDAQLPGMFRRYTP